MASGSSGGVLRKAERLGLNRGLVGGSRGWLYVGTGLWTLRTVRRMAQRKTEVLLAEELQPGDRIVIANGRTTLDTTRTSTARSAGRGRRSAR